ncbi:MAG: hypothetical protein JNM17_16960 [Archangium sp.]|nr:hypothetical protein [Archangium sp.]
MTALVLCAFLGVAPELGQVVRQDGFQFRPPSAFRMARMDLFHGTRAGSVARSSGSTRYLAAALIDGDGEDAASLLFSVVEETVVLGPSSRDEFSTAVVRHFTDELGQPFQLERAQVTDGRVEVLGAIRQGSQLRRILVVVWPGEGKHLVGMASAPSGRWDELLPSIDASFDSLKEDPSISARPPQRYVWAFVALLAALLMISIGLWRRRQAARAG